MIDEVRKCPSIFNKLKIVPDNTDEYGNFYLSYVKTYLERDVNKLIRAKRLRLTAKLI